MREPFPQLHRLMLPLLLSTIKFDRLCREDDDPEVVHPAHETRGTDQVRGEHGDLELLDPETHDEEQGDGGAENEGQVALPMRPGKGEAPHQKDEGWNEERDAVMADEVGREYLCPSDHNPVAEGGHFVLESSHEAQHRVDGAPPSPEAEPGPDPVPMCASHGL